MDTPPDSTQTDAPQTLPEAPLPPVKRGGVRNKIILGITAILLISGAVTAGLAQTNRSVSNMNSLDGIQRRN